MEQAVIAQVQCVSLPRFEKAQLFQNLIYIYNNAAAKKLFTALGLT